jgi:hypothetical protein
MDSHVSETVKSCNYHLQALRHLRQSVTREVANSMACSIINTRLDYCNSLFHGVSEKNISKLQRIQNRAARIVCNVGRRELSSKELLIDLHWLPVRYRVEFKTAALCFTAYRLHQPSYLTSVLQAYNPQRHLRSSSQELLHVPSYKTVLGSRRFSVAAPYIWNNLPFLLRTVDNFTAFKPCLKTHLFRRFTD